MDETLQTTFSNTFSLMKNCCIVTKILLKYVTKDSLTIFQHWCGLWLGATKQQYIIWINESLVFWRIYASLRFSVQASMYRWHGEDRTDNEYRPIKDIFHNKCWSNLSHRPSRHRHQHNQEMALRGMTLCFFNIYYFESINWSFWWTWPLNFKLMTPLWNVFMVCYWPVFSNSAMAAIYWALIWKKK